MKPVFVLVWFTAIAGMASSSDCSEGEFTCNNGNCIPESWVCDGWGDCGDKSDEPEGCPPCPKGWWQCSSGDCIPEWWICDGKNDCVDSSDEPEDCGPCPVGFWQCDNENCVPEWYICDGDNDCGDWSDENCGVLGSRQANLTIRPASIQKVYKVKVASVGIKKKAYKKVKKTLQANKMMNRKNGLKNMKKQSHQ